jgi:transposase
MRLYQDVNDLPPKNRIQKDENTVKISAHSFEPDLSEYESMTKEELIKELVKSRINEARLKKDTK